MRKIIMLLTTICLTTALVACGGTKKEVKTVTDKPAIEEKEVQENGLTKEEEENAKKITEEFARSVFKSNYKTDTEETIKKFTEFLTEEGEKSFDENFIKTQLQELKDKQEIVTVKSINIDNIAKEENNIKVIYTVNTYIDNSIEEVNKKDDSTKCTLTLNKDYKIFKFENGI